MAGPGIPVDPGPPAAYVRQVMPPQSIHVSLRCAALRIAAAVCLTFLTATRGVTPVPKLGLSATANFHVAIPRSSLGDRKSTRLNSSHT